MNNDRPVFDRPGPGLCLRICGTPWEGDGLRLVQNCPMYFLFCPLRQRGACSPVSEKTFQWWHKASIKFFDSKNTRKNWLYWSLRSRASSLGKGWAPQKPQTIGHFWGRLHLIYLLIFRPKMFSCFSFSNSFFVPVSKSDVKKPHGHGIMGKYPAHNLHANLLHVFCPPQMRILENGGKKCNEPILIPIPRDSIFSVNCKRKLGLSPLWPALNPQSWGWMASAYGRSLPPSPSPEIYFF